MKRPIQALVFVLSLTGALAWAQAGSSPQQTAPAAPADKTSAQKKQDESECMKWAKQQVGLEQSGGAQQQQSGANQPAAGGAGDKGAAAPDKSAANQAPADNSAQSNANSGLAGAASGAAASLGGGAANSKYAQLVKEAYNNCMQKKGYTPKK